MVSLPPPKLSEKDKRFLLKFCRASLEAAFTGEPRKPLEALEKELSSLPPTFLQTHPCFVTLLAKSGRLRGCIGTLAADAPLYQNVFEFANKAAFEDPRFPPLLKKELNEIVIEISILGPHRPLKSLDEIEIGKHGLFVESTYKRGVLLAKVASERNWTKEQFLEETCLKANLEPRNLAKYKVSYFEEIELSEQKN